MKRLARKILYLQVGFIGFLRIDSNYLYSGAPSIMVVQQSAT